MLLVVVLTDVMLVQPPNVVLLLHYCMHFELLLVNTVASLSPHVVVAVVDTHEVLDDNYVAYLPLASDITLNVVVVDFVQHQNYWLLVADDGFGVGSAVEKAVDTEIAVAEFVPVETDYAAAVFVADAAGMQKVAVFVPVVDSLFESARLVLVGFVLAGFVAGFVAAELGAVELAIASD